MYGLFAYIINMFEKKKLSNALRYYKHHQEYLNKIIEALNESKLDYAIVGGFVKWVLSGDDNIDNGPRDFDIVVNCTDEAILLLVESLKLPYIRNDFGGIKIKPSENDTFAGKDIDIWTLESHKPFEALESLYKSFSPYKLKAIKVFSNIPTTAWISLDGATWVVNKNKLYAKNTKKSLKTKIVFITDMKVLNSYKHENRFMIAAKLIKYYYLGYDLSIDCWRIIKDELGREPDKIEDFLNSHYNYQISWQNFIDEKIMQKIS